MHTILRGWRLGAAGLLVWCFCILPPLSKAQDWDYITGLLEEQNYIGYNVWDNVGYLSYISWYTEQIKDSIRRMETLGISVTNLLRLADGSQFSVTNLLRALVNVENFPDATNLYHLAENQTISVTNLLRFEPFSFPDATNLYHLAPGAQVGVSNVVSVVVLNPVSNIIVSMPAEPVHIEGTVDAEVFGNVGINGPVTVNEWDVLDTSVGGSGNPESGGSWAGDGRNQGWQAGGQAKTYIYDTEQAFTAWSNTWHGMMSGLGAPASGFDARLQSVDDWQEDRLSDWISLRNGWNAVFEGFANPTYTGGMKINLGTFNFGVCSTNLTIDLTGENYSQVFEFSRWLSRFFFIGWAVITFIVLIRRVAG